MSNRDLIYLGSILFTIYLVKRVGTTAIKSIGTAIDPVSTNNIFYQETNKIGSAITGKPKFDLGIWIYDITHGIN